jgi:DNA-binding CsgD family transcriptional regulator
MKIGGGRREWALGMAFLLCTVFGYIMHFLTGFYVGPEKVLQAQVSHLIGCIAGALFLPFMLPLGVLRTVANQRFARQPQGFSKRLVLIGCLFLPNIVLLLLGLQSWLSNPVNAVVRGISNGVLMALVNGLFISLAGKRRNLWAGFSLALSFFIFYLILSVQGRYDSDFFANGLFYGSGLLIVGMGVFLFLYLAAGVGDTEAASGTAEQAGLPLAGKKRQVGFLFPLLAAAVIFWTNSFTERLFMPVFHLPQGFHLTNVIMMIALPVAGFFADRYRQRFFNVFILFSFGVFLLAPSLLQFSHSETVFLVLYTLNATSIQLIVVVFPFAILDLYWERTRNNEQVTINSDEGREGVGGYWGYLLASSMYLFRVLAGAQIGVFSSFPVNNPYAVLLLSLVVILYFVLSLKLVRFQIGAFGNIAIPSGADVKAVSPLSGVPLAATPEESFDIHGLSKREREIGVLILQGQTNKEIAEKLCVQEDTVKKHSYSIFDKYGVKRRTEFMAKVLGK